MEQSNVFMLDISKLTPSQLYISEEKLQKVNHWFHGNVAEIAHPIPIKKLAGRYLITDGHTRAVAAWLAGIREIPCTWDTGQMDWAAYAADITVCAEEGVTSIEKLAERIVSADDYKRLWVDRCDSLENEWFYKVLRQSSETIFFTRSFVQIPDCDIRPVDIGVDTGEYFQLFHNEVPVATGCIEKYSYEFWEAADIKTAKEYRNLGFGYHLTAFLTNLIVAGGKTATCRTLPENIGMNRIIVKSGYQKLYAKTKCK